MNFNRSSWVTGEWRQGLPLRAWKARCFAGEQARMLSYFFGVSFSMLYTCTIFISALLLFLIQPIIAKAILPWFGGSAGVWTTCMFFFQAVLVLGYLYSHWITRNLRPRMQIAIHVTLLA